MKQRIFKRILLSIIVIGCYIPVYAGSLSDSLTGYLESAAKNNPLVLQKYYEYLSAMQKVPQVGALPDPQLDLGFYVKPMEILSGKQVADLKLMQMFPWFGVLKNAKEEMNLMAKAKYESYIETKLQVLFDVRETWFELQKLKEAVRINEKNSELLKNIENVAIAKFGSARIAGTGLSDIYRIQIESGDLNNNILLLKNKIITLTARFNEYLNRPENSPVTLPDSLTQILPVFPIEEYSDSLLVSNPALSSMKYEQESLIVRKKIVTGMGYPMVGIGVNYSVIGRNAMSTSSMNGNDMIMPMISITLPVYRKKYDALQKEAELKRTSVEKGYDATLNSLRTEYFQILQMLYDAQRRVVLYRNQSSLSKKTLDLLIKDFSVSGAGLIDILRVRQQNLDYELKQFEAVTDYNKSIAAIERLTAHTINLQTQ